MATTTVVQSNTTAMATTTVAQSITTPAVESTASTSGQMLAESMMAVTTSTSTNVVTTQTCTSPPGQTVAAIPELLAMILQQVDNRTVLRAQRASSAFRDALVLKGSQKLRRKLWLHRTVNKALTVQLNPLLLDHRRRLYIRRLMLWPQKKVEIYFPSLQHVQALMAKESASWRDMIVVQPHDPEIEWNVGYWPEPGKEKMTLIRPRFEVEAPTLGEVVDLLLLDCVPGYKSQYGRVAKEVVVEDEA